jgi:hypothetical protein
MDVTIPPEPGGFNPQFFEIRVLAFMAESDAALYKAR